MNDDDGDGDSKLNGRNGDYEMSAVIGRRVGSLLIVGTHMENKRQMVECLCLCGRTVTKRLDVVMRSGRRAACSKECYQRRMVGLDRAWDILFVNELEWMVNDDGE